MKYFSNIPTISYGNNFVRNILTRVKIVNDFKNKSSVYYPYVLEEASPSGVRYENLAFDYYDDVDNVWILHLTNEIVDPYYDIPLTQDQFESFIEKKYGSLRKAHEKIVFYRNNYDQDDSIITFSGYDSLIAERKRYWTPTVNYDNNIIGYERIKDDTVVSTNKVITMEISAANSLNIDEKVTQATTGATGFVAFCNTSVLTLQHIGGSFSNSYSIVGDDTAISADPISEITVLSQNISANVEAYFSPISAYEYESELNESKKTINVLDRRYASMLEASFIEAMSQ